MTARPVLLASALARCLLACSTHADAPRIADTVEPRDANAGELLDASEPGDADAHEETSDADARALLGRRLTLRDGRVVAGELVASYDQAAWVEPMARRTFALFDPERFAAWPDDRSLVFVDEDDVTEEVRFELPASTSSYRDWLAQRAVGVARVPFELPAMVATAHEEHHLAEDGYGDFAWDVVLADSDGARWRGDGRELEDYWSWDAPLHAPADGLVVEVVRDAPDIAPGVLPADGLDAPENLVGIRLTGAYHVYLLHLRQHSIPAAIDVGVTVASGEPLGRVGNSGTTLEPHLHLVMLYWDFERARFWSVPAEMFDVWRARAATGARYEERIDPTRGDWISAAPF